MLMVKEGERTAISTRVAELDQIMPQYLGVSKAVLDSVIFCHQDESLWPMSEPSVLKRRFDEIFEALKYTKAIENIKILRKNKNEELGKLKILEQHAREDKERGERVSSALTAKLQCLTSLPRLRRSLPSSMTRLKSYGPRHMSSTPRSRRRLRGLARRGTTPRNLRRSSPSSQANALMRKRGRRTCMISRRT